MHIFTSKYTHRMYVALIIIGINTRHTFTALDCFGWKKNDGRLEIEWETPENQAKTRERVEHVLNDCKARQAALQRDASARGNYKDVDLDATV